MKIANGTVAHGLAAAAVVGALACGGENGNTDVKSPETTSAPVPASTTSNTTPGESTNTQSAPYGGQLPGGNAATPSTTLPGSGSTRAVTSLSDEQVAELVSDVNQGELDQARFATGHAKNAQVLQFAKHMLSDHTDLGQKMTSMLQAQGIRPSASPMSQDLKSSAQQTLTTMEGKSGLDLDRDYIDAQVREHKDALDLLDNELISNAKNAQLKARLEEARTKVASHLSEAQTIQNTLSTK